MAIAVIGSGVSAGSPDTNSVTTPGGTYNTAGATGLIGAAVDTSGGSGIFSDNYSNVWNPLVAETIDIIFIRLFDVVSSPVSGTGHTFTVTGTGTFPSVAALGLTGSGAFDTQQNSANGANVSALSAGSVSPTQDNCIVVTAAATRNNAGTFTIGSGFIIAQQLDNDGNHFSLALAYKIQTAAEAENPQWQWNGGTQDAAAVIAVYRAGAGSSGFSLIVNNMRPNAFAPGIGR